jgi:hypothetical protein
MKVIKKGNKQNGWSKKYKCTGNGYRGGGCGAELQVEETDLYHTYSSAMGETDTHTTFMCVECGVETDIPSSDAYAADIQIPTAKSWMKQNYQSLPENVQKRIERRYPGDYKDYDRS